MGLNTHLCIIAHLELIEISKDRPNYEYSRMIHSTSSIFVYNTHNMHTNAIALHSHTHLIVSFSTSSLLQLTDKKGLGKWMQYGINT